MKHLFLTLILIIYLVQVKVYVNANNYTYICLETEQNFCIGISPGDALPTADDEFKLQIKNRLRNEDNNQAWKKTRFDISNANGTIKMTNFDLYLAQKPRSGSVFLLEEPSVFNLTSFTENINEEGVIKLTDSDDCLTVMQCSPLDNGKREFCNPNTNKEVRFSSDLQTGAYLRFRPCTHSFSQIFRQRLDCADDCAPVNIGDGVCDLACNNTMCDFDHGDCLFTLTSLPTDSPSESPTFTDETFSPSDSPTPWPTYAPSGLPTMPPSGSPTTFPTNQPVSYPTSTPLYKTETPTVTEEYEFDHGLNSPTITPDNDGGDTALTAFLLTSGILLLVLFCCFGYWISYLREEERKTETEKEEESINSTDTFIGAPNLEYIHIEVDPEAPKREWKEGPKNPMSPKSNGSTPREEPLIRDKTENEEEIVFHPLPESEEDEEKINNTDKEYLLHAHEEEEEV